MSMPRSVLRHRPISSEVQEWVVADLTGPRPRRSALSLAWIQQTPPLVLIVGSMLLTFLLLWAIGSIWAWGALQVNMFRYGSPPTIQLDHVVGHGGQSSHFTAWNLHGQIYVLEIPGNTPAASRLLVGPHLIGPNADLAPVQLTFEGDPRHPELLIAVQGVLTRFHNTGICYVPVSP